MGGLSEPDRWIQYVDQHTEVPYFVNEVAATQHTTQHAPHTTHHTPLPQ